jgi:hypothetical protein
MKNFKEYFKEKAPKDERTILGSIKLPEDEVNIYWDAIGNVATKETDAHVSVMDMLKRKKIFVTPVMLKAIKSAMKKADDKQKAVLKKVLASVKK